MGASAEEASSEASSGGETGSEAGSEAESESGSDVTTGAGYCGGVEFFARPVPLRVVWVVDNSAASTQPYDHDHDASTAMLTPRERMLEFSEWFFARYPGPNGCFPLAPGMVLAPAPDAEAPPNFSACSVDAAQVEPDVDSQAPFNAAWSSLPAPAGALALADAYAQAVNSLGGVPDWEQPVIAVLTGGPPACGGADSEVVDNRLVQRMNDAWNDQGIQSVVLRTGPQVGITPDAVDGVPDGVDLALYWASLGAVYGSWHLDVGEQQAISDLFDIASPSYGDCSYDLAQTETGPPANADLVDIVGVDGAAWPKLELDESACEALGQDPGDGGGWIWNEAPNRIRLCGEACAATQCAAQNPWPDNGVEVEVPYLCE